jgi:ABC-type sugar transport system ATPase subunit
MKQTSLDLAKEYGVHYKSICQPIKSLSGGNQQKVVVARCVQTNPQVLILSDPTRGIDVAAKDDIHQQILSLASRGTSIILISSELEEVIALSNRVAVFCSGQLVSILEQDQVSPTTIMSLATPKRNGSNGEKHNEIN